MTGSFTAGAEPPTQRRLDADHPWPGLASFLEEERQFFHGRDTESARLLRMARRERLSVLFGRSGLGKTSLLQAGLFPRLRAEHVLPVYIRLDHSGDGTSLSRQVTVAIARAATAVGYEAPSAREGETLWEYFHRVDAKLWTERNRPAVPLLVFDQFEEMFTIGRASASRCAATGSFLIELADLVEGRPPAAVRERLDDAPEQAREFAFARHAYQVLLSLREDFLADLETLRELMPAVAHNRMRLDRMSGAAAYEVVAHDPELVTDEVAEQIVRFVAAERTEGDPTPLREIEVEPALLSVFCSELNKRRLARGERRITTALLEGAREQVLSGFYEDAVADVTPAMRAFVEDKLITVSGFRDSVALENARLVDGVTDEAIGTLVSRRLIRVEDSGGVMRLELTHDLLCGVVSASRESRAHAEAERRRMEDHARRDAQRLRLTRAKRRSAFVLCLLFAIVGVVASQMLERLEGAVFEVGVRVASPAPSDRIAIIAIDDLSIANLGRWPWPRDRLARFIDVLRAGEPKVIALEVLFFEPQVSPELAILEDLSSTVEETGAADQELESALAILRDKLTDARTMLDTDAALAASMERAANVVLPMVFFLGEPLGNPDAPPPDFLSRIAVRQVVDNAGAMLEGDLPVPSYRFVAPLPLFGEAAVAIGHVNRVSGVAGEYREPLIVRYYDSYFPSFALQVAAVSLNLRPEDVRIKLGEGVELGRLAVQTDAKLNLHPFFYHDVASRPAFAIDSLFDVLTGKIPVENYRDKIVLVGATATGVAPTYSTPLGPQTPGLVATAHTLSSILEENFTVSPAWVAWVEWAAFVLVALYLVVLYGRLTWGTAISIALGIVLLAVQFGLASTQAISVGLLLPVLMLVAWELLMPLVLLALASKDKRRPRSGAGAAADSGVDS